MHQPSDMRPKDEPLPDEALPHRPLANQITATASRFARIITQTSNISISAVSMRALGYITRNGPQRISYLASYESISQPAMTSAVNRLAEDGLVIRQPDPADARAQLVAITEEGREILDGYRQQVTAILQPKLEALSSDDYETIQRTVAILDALTNDLIGVHQTNESR